MDIQWVCTAKVGLLYCVYAKTIVEHCGSCVGLFVRNMFDTINCGVCGMCVLGLGVEARHMLQP